MVLSQKQSWKLEKNKKKKNKIVRWVILILIVFIAINIITKIPKAIRIFTQPFEQLSGGSESLSFLDFTYRSNILFLSYLSEEILLDASLISYDPIDNKITVIHFDLKSNDTLRKKVNIVFRKTGVDGAQKYISLGIFVPVDRYIALEKLDMSEKYILDVKNKLKLPGVAAKAFSIDEIFGNGLKTNMNSKEYLDFILKLRQATISESSYFKISAKELPDSRTLSVLENQFIDNRVLEEGAAVAVQNSSGFFGLASKLKEYLTNLGADVLIIKGNEEIVQESYVLIKEDRNLVQSRVSTIFSFEKRRDEEADFPGNILFVIGEDAIDKLTFE